MNDAQNETFPFHVTECFGQHLLADIACPTTDPCEAEFELCVQQLKDQHDPLIRDLADHAVRNLYRNRL